MSITKIVSGIPAVEPIARNQAERIADETRFAVLRNAAPASDRDRAVKSRDWVAREGTIAALTGHLEHVASGHVSI